MTDGLAQLAKRGRRTREIPPPRNPARSAPVQLTVPNPTNNGGATDEAAHAPVALETKAAAATATTAMAVGQPAQAPASTVKAKAELKVVTVYLEQDDDDFLETITHTGRINQPKTAISRSAVVRLALERLHAQMSPGEIVAELRPRGDNSSTGRKRR